MMRILAVTTFFPNSADRHRAVFVKNLVRAMREHGPISVISPIPYAPAFPRIARWRALRRIERRENQDGMEVLHPRFLVLPKIWWFTGFGYFLGIFRLLRQWKLSHGPFLVHAHCAYPDGVGVALAARLLGLPYVVTAHGSDINVYASAGTLRPQIRWALAGADGLIAVSAELAAKINHLLQGAAKRSECIPCAGFDPAVFFPRPAGESRGALQIGARARVVAFVGELVPIKGVEFLVDAWATLQRRGFLGNQDLLAIIGDGKCRAELERRVEDAGIRSRVRFTGAIPQAEVSRWIAASDLLCLPSRNEGTPNVVVEALACGIPVVSTRVGGVPALVRDGVNGLLVPPGNPDALADALAAALSRSWDRNRVRESVAHLTWATIAEKNWQFLESVNREAQRASVA